MARKLLRDAVHGDIEVGALEVELMDTPEFQRLRGIKQLGTAYLVFPSAMHTRFEHSLGTSWMAARIVEALRRNHPVTADEERLIRVTALLHDLTHIPFGHTLEDERRVLPRHDKDKDRVQYYFRESAIGGILRREGIQDAVIAALTEGGSLVGDIVGGSISADLLDYLRRDTLFCGLSQYYDARIFESFVIDGDRLAINLEKRGVLRRDALSELINLLRIRYSLSERVYFHHTKIASGAMISKSVELAIQSGFDPNELRSLNDQTLIWVLRQRYTENPAMVHILDCFSSRRLYTPCTVLTVEEGEEKRRRIVERFHYDRESRESVEQAIARAAQIEPHQVIIYCPSIGMSLPEADVPVRINGQLLPLSGSNNDEIRILKEKHKALWKFFVLVDRDAAGQRDIVARAAAQFLGTN